MTPSIAIQEVIAAYDHRRHTDINANEMVLLQNTSLSDLAPAMIKALPRIRSWQGRNAILFRLVRFARTDPEVVRIAIAFLSDPAYQVRMQACAILAYSLRPDALPHLESLLFHKNLNTRMDAAAAQYAIRHGNHHYWFDRGHTGSSFWVMNPGDDPRGIL